MNPISTTAFYTCGLRAEDAQRPAPVVGDDYATRLMDPRGWSVIEAMRGMQRPAMAVLVRHRMIDDLLRDELARQPDLRVVVLGCGLDSRPFRLTGGRWIEIDEPALIEFKETRLPAADAPNPLTRIAVDFGNESLQQRLLPLIEAQRTLVVIEGVLLYMDQPMMSATAHAVAALSPEVTVICDIMSRAFFKRVARDVHERLQAQGAPFKIQSVDVPAVWSAAGFRRVSRHSIPDAMSARGLVNTPRWLLASALRWARDGYVVAQLHKE